MSDKPSDLVQGTLEMLVLKTLALEPMLMTLPPAGPPTAQTRTIRAAHRVGRTSLTAAHNGSCSR